MLTKEFSITLDMKRPLAFHPFEVVEGDTGNVLTILLENDGTAMELTGCDICILFASSKGFAMQDLTSGLALGSETGELQLELYPESFGAGDVRAEVQVYSGTQKKTLVTSKTFTFRCRTSLLGEGILQASDAYPPLITATKGALDAAAEARAAMAALTGLVQADWAETGDTEPSFVRNKPAALPPTAHAASHGAGGSDAVTPAGIGAAAAVHAAAHAPGGEDPLTGYERTRLQVTDVSVPVSAWAEDTSGTSGAALYEDYGYRAAVPLTGVLATMTPEIIFACADAVSGIFAPVCAAYDGGVYLYASEIPDAEITIPTMIVWKAVSA